MVKRREISGGHGTRLALVGAACGAIAVAYGVHDVRAQGPGQAPVAAFKWSNCPAEESPVTFDASKSRDADGEIVRYIWDFGDGTTAEGMIFEHHFEEPAAYIISLTVVDNDAHNNNLKLHIPVDDICRE